MFASIAIISCSKPRTIAGVCLIHLYRSDEADLGSNSYLHCGDWISRHILNIKDIPKCLYVPVTFCLI